MKKYVLLFIPLCGLSLTSCVQFIDEEHSLGLSGGDSQIENDYINPTFVDNPTLPSELSLSFTISFKKSNSESGYISTYDEFLNILASNNDTSHINSIDVDNMRYVSQGYQGLKLGLNIGDNYGFISLNTNSTFKAVSIKAYPRFVETFDYQSGALELDIDKESALSADKNNFIKVNGDFITADEVKSSTINFIFDEDKSTLDLYSYGGRIVIDSISFYN